MLKLLLTDVEVVAERAVAEEVALEPGLGLPLGLRRCEAAQHAAQTPADQQCACALRVQQERPLELRRRRSGLCKQRMWCEKTKFVQQSLKIH